MMVLIFVLSLLITGSRAGLLERMVDTLLGRVPGYGVPIWLTSELSLGEAIGRQNLKRLSAHDLSYYHIHPYREVQPADVSIPGVHGKKNEKTEKIRGWAVYPSDPLWKRAVQENSVQDFKNGREIGLPLEIVLDKKIFAQEFNSRTYWEALKGKLPHFIFQSLPVPVSETDHLSSLKNNIIWLKIKTGWHADPYEYLPFKIRWSSNRIQALERLWFLFPLSTYHAIEIFQGIEGFYFPESEGKVQDRVKVLSIYDPDQKYRPSDIHAFHRCLGHSTIKKNRDEYMIHLDAHPLARPWVDACAKQFDMTIKGERYIPPPHINIDQTERSIALSYLNNGYLHFPRGIPPFLKPFADNIDDTHDTDDTNNINDIKNNTNHTNHTNHTLKKVDAVSYTGGFHYVMAYIPQRILLMEAVKKITGITKKNINGLEDIPMFYVHPTYRDALARFGFLSKIVDVFKWPTFLFFSLFVVMVLFIQLGNLVDHRRHHYGFLLSMGYEKKDIYLMIGAQITSCIALGFTLALVYVYFIRIFLNQTMGALLPQFLENMAFSEIENIDLLPLTGLEYGSLGLSILLASYLMIIAHLWVNMKIKPFMDSEPSYLLHE
jgi:hypothetical protein